MWKAGWGLGTYSSCGSLESLDLRESLVLPYFLGDSTRRNETTECLDGQIPELIVFLVEQHYKTGGLGVEGRRNVQDRRVDELFDLGVGYRTVLA